MLVDEHESWYSHLDRLLYDFVGAVHPAAGPLRQRRVLELERKGAAVCRRGVHL